MEQYRVNRVWVDDAHIWGQSLYTRASHHCHKQDIATGERTKQPIAERAATKHFT